MKVSIDKRSPLRGIVASELGMTGRHKSLNTRRERKIEILPQPTESTCGPTCLHSVYSYLGSEFDLQALIEEIPETESGGTFSVILALHALRNGFAASIYSYNLKTFDPTWEGLSSEAIASKLETRLHRTRSPKARANLQAYVDFLKEGGTLSFEELTPALLKRILKKDTPIIAGLSSTHLYRDSRLNKDGDPDDVHGDPEGHFVVISNWNASEKQFIVADPYRKNPVSAGQIYGVGVHRLINSILLGIVTYDANMLVIQSKSNT